MASTTPSLFSSLTRGAFAGVVGAAVLGLVQEKVEMPLTGRGESYAPAHFAHQLFGLEHHGGNADVLNWGSHLGFGTQWGVARALVARRGLHGIPALVTTFATVYPATVAVGTALDVYRPSEWTGEDWAIDVLDKLVMATVTGAVYQFLLAPRAKQQKQDQRRRRRHRAVTTSPTPSGPTPTTSWGR
ncbi:MAG TPA: hypothetical protein VFJ12_11300 [Segeticoccus sp.]|nr:hypothetical protein [Segeticoccus sp.]